MVANLGGADTPVGVWLNADVGQSAPDSKTDRKQVKAGGKGTQGGSGSLAFRPGWHLGEIPLSQQFNRLNKETGIKELFPENFIWAECEIAADKDYQEEAMSCGYTENGKFRHSYAGLPRIPVDGYYTYRTNPNPNTTPWYITGAMKVNRLLSDKEVAKILEEKGIEAPQRQGGEKSLEDFGFSEELLNRNTAQKNSTTAESGVRYMLLGTTADGIEVYETSEENKNKSYAEKLNIFAQNFITPGTDMYIGNSISYIDGNGNKKVAYIDRYTKNKTRIEPLPSVNL